MGTLHNVGTFFTGEKHGLAKGVTVKEGDKQRAEERQKEDG